VGSVFQWRGVSFGGLGSWGEVGGWDVRGGGGVGGDHGDRNGHGRSGGVLGEDTLPSGNCAYSLPGSGELFVVQALGMKCERERCAAMQIMYLREGE